MAQTSYDLYIEKAHMGMLADARPHTIETHSAEAEILFGYGVVAGTDTLVQVALPSAIDDVFRGVAVSTWAGEQNASGDGAYQAESAVNVLRKGAIWVMVNSNVVVDDAVYFVYDTDLGEFRNDNTNATLVPNATFKTTANDGEMAVIEINLP